MDGGHGFIATKSRNKSQQDSIKWAASFKTYLMQLFH